MALLVGTDIGTLGTKTVVVDCEGRVHGEAFQEYDVLTPAQGWAEQWPNPWERAVYHTIREAVKATGAPKEDFQGLCISGLYGGSGIPVDKDYRPLRPCLIWADRRATQECEWVEETIGVDRIYQVTGNVVCNQTPNRRGEHRPYQRWKPGGSLRFRKEVLVRGVNGRDGHP